MRCGRDLRTMKPQRGGVLLLLAILLVLGTASVLLAGLKRSAAFSSDIDMELAQAREALIGYALTVDTRDSTRLPGVLPCPDRDGDGLSDSPCGAPGESVIGMLPWQTLGLPGAGQCLWYAVSGTYKESAGVYPSSDTDGMFLVLDAARRTNIGRTPGSQALAMVFAPGSPGPRQNRRASARGRTSCGSRFAADPVNQAGNFLDRFGGVDNARGILRGARGGSAGSQPLPTRLPSVFIQGEVSTWAGKTGFNDQLLWITPTNFEDVYRLMNRRVAERVSACLASYAGVSAQRLPWAARLKGTAPPDYDDDTGQRFGRIPDRLDDSASKGLSPSWPVDPRDARYRCFAWPWWGNWREQVFLAVDATHTPQGVPGPPLKLDSNPFSYLTLVAGRRLGAQSRGSNNERGTVSSYLEGDNVPGPGAGLIPPGDDGFETQGNGLFNDYVLGSNLPPVSPPPGGGGPQRKGAGGPGKK